MKIVLKSLMIAVVVAIGFFSCSKDDEVISNVAPTSAGTGSSTTNNYPVTEALFFNAIADNGNGFKVWGDADFELEGLTGFQSCRNDDFMTLRTDSTYSYTNGAITCGADWQNKAGVWEINFINKTITFDKGTFDEYTATIIFLSNSKFVLEGTWVGLKIKGDYKS